jgi:hypothetical protein
MQRLFQGALGANLSPVTSRRTSRREIFFHMLENHPTARSRTSGEYLFFVFMCSILSRNKVSGTPGQFMVFVIPPTTAFSDDLFTAV